MENSSTPQQPHVSDQGQDTHALKDWKVETRQLNDLFWKQLITVGVSGVGLVDEPPLAGVAASQNHQFPIGQSTPEAQERRQMTTNDENQRQRQEPEASQTSPRHAEAEPEMTVADEPVFLSTRQLARYVGLSVRTIQRLMEDPDFPVTYLGGAVRHDRRAVDVYLARHSRGITPNKEAPRDGGDGPGGGAKGRKRRT